MTAGNSFKPDFEGAIVRPSPNYEIRKDAAKPRFLILHYTGMENAEAAEKLLRSEEHTSELQSQCCI